MAGPVAKARTKRPRVGRYQWPPGESSEIPAKVRHASEGAQANRLAARHSGRRSPVNLRDDVVRSCARLRGFRGRAPPADSGILLGQTAMMNHEPAPGTDGKRSARQDRPHSPQFFPAHPTPPGNRTIRHPGLSLEILQVARRMERVIRRSSCRPPIDFDICAICEICGWVGISFFSSAPPGRHT